MTVSGLVLLALLEVQAKAQRNQEGNAGNLLEPRWDGRGIWQNGHPFPKAKGPTEGQEGKEQRQAWLHCCRTHMRLCPVLYEILDFLSLPF